MRADKVRPDVERELGWRLRRRGGLARLLLPWLQLDLSEAGASAAPWRGWRSAPATMWCWATLAAPTRSGIWRPNWGPLARAATPREAAAAGEIVLVSLPV